MAKNPLIRSYPKKLSKPLPNKSAGILDDYAVRKVVATKEGSITKIPTQDIDITNKLYVDTLTTNHPHQDVRTTASPEFVTLHVNSAGVNEVARFESTDSVAFITLKDSISSSQLAQAGVSLEFRIDPTDTVANSRINFTVDGDEKMRIDSAGTVEISNDLDVTGDIKTTGKIITDNIETNTGNIVTITSGENSYVFNDDDFSPSIEQDLGTVTKKWGSYYGSGDIDIDGDLFSDQVLTRDLTMTSPASTNYKFTSTTNGGALGVVSTVSGVGSRIDLHTADGDGTDNVQWRVWAKGTNTSIIDSEYLRIIYNAGTLDYTIDSKATGSGTVRPIRLETSGNTNQIKLNIDGSVSIEAGDLKFINTGSGLPFGSMYNHDTATTVTIPGVNTATRIPSGFTVGQTNNTTFGNSREIDIGVRGRYLINWQITFTTASSNQEIEGFIMVNNVMNNQASAHRRIGTATDSGSISGCCILNLNSNDLISLGVLNETSASNVIIGHANMTLTHIGG